MLEPVVEAALVLCRPADDDGGVFGKQRAHPGLVPTWHWAVPHRRSRCRPSGGPGGRRRRGGSLLPAPDIPVSSTRAMPERMSRTHAHRQTSGRRPTAPVGPE
jgi:hypothetical protein